MLGTQKVFDIRTNEIPNSLLMKVISKRVSIEIAAKSGGLERVYTNAYGSISMIAHGRAFDLRTKSDNENEIYPAVSAALGAM